MNKQRIVTWFAGAAILILVGAIALVLSGWAPNEPDGKYYYPAPDTDPSWTYNPDQKYPEPEPMRYRLIRLSENGTLTEIPATITPATQVVRKPFAKDVYLATEGNTVSLLDAKAGKFTELFKFPSTTSTMVTGFTVLPGSTKIALSTATDNGVSRYDGDAWVYDIATKELKHLVGQHFGLYSVLILYGYNPATNDLIVRAVGGDAGAIWGSWYTVNLTSPAFKRLELFTDKSLPPQGEMGNDPTLPALPSPSGAKFALARCPDTVENYEVYACKNGAEVLVYDLNTKKTATVFKNTATRIGDEVGQYKTVGDIAWLDEDRLIIAAPEAIYRVTVSLGTVDLIGEPFKNQPQQYGMNESGPQYIRLDTVTSNYIVFDKGFTNEYFLLNVATGKITQLSTMDATKGYPIFLD